MVDPIDWCKYFADIEADPSAITPRLTVRQWLQAREHVYGCDSCNLRVERVLAKEPKEQLPDIGMN